ncbi:MAG: winged helix-turn-helix domain-containing protein [Acidobacteria bacterium]|nr:winged helix-turn-helix domain-containing protein [Acidobacteriota bacterium]
MRLSWKERSGALQASSGSFLDQHGETALNRLKQGARLSDQMLLMGLGWLAREGKLTLVRQGRTLRIGLRERSAA